MRSKKNFKKTMRKLLRKNLRPKTNKKKLITLKVRPNKRIKKKRNQGKIRKRMGKQVKSMLLNLAQRLSCTKSRITAPLQLKKWPHLQTLLIPRVQQRMQLRSQSKLKTMTTSMIMRLNTSKIR